jgi:hypothetical protein
MEDINGIEYIFWHVVHATPSSVGIRSPCFGENNIVTEYNLYQNHPNPFNPITNITFDVLVEGLVSLKVYNLLGQELRTLVNEKYPMGRYEVLFDGTNMPSGIYFYTMTIDGFTDTKKMLLMQ